MSEDKERNDRTVYINNLSYRRNEQGVKELFTPFGFVNTVNILIDPQTGVSKGMAFVEMKTLKGAQNAIEKLNGAVVDGRTVKVRAATLKDKPIKKFYPPKPKNEEPKAPKKTVVKEAPKKVLKKPTVKVKRVKKKSGLEIMLERVKKA